MIFMFSIVAGLQCSVISYLARFLNFSCLGPQRVGFSWCVCALLCVCVVKGWRPLSPVSCPHWPVLVRICILSSSHVLLFCCCYFSFFGCPAAYGVPGPGIRSKLQLQCMVQQLQICNPLCQAGEQTYVAVL